ncbi:hypothetical protein BN381_270007 [Candidatus Microthrix parvicella RN1]|uniref:Uncharacterized protein n=1 Tax=Candidatus Neomicrothrix parvicella RN1 TaxID=1229780 RepID=R4Z2X4_9ACTN|nr:hypothetical protein BN381_270007 [Candidatus Microthrix parvicella RN1]
MPAEVTSMSARLLGRGAALAVPDVATSEPPSISSIANDFNGRLSLRRCGLAMDVRLM